MKPFGTLTESMKIVSFAHETYSQFCGVGGEMRAPKLLFAAEHGTGKHVSASQAFAPPVVP